jgi:hypothetical protein
MSIPMELKIIENLKEGFEIALLGVFVIFSFALTFLLFSSPSENYVAKTLALFFAVLLAGFFILKNILEILKDMKIVR